MFLMYFSSWSKTTPCSRNSRSPSLKCDKLHFLKYSALSLEQDFSTFINERTDGPHVTHGPLQYEKVNWRTYLIRFFKVCGGSHGYLYFFLFAFLHTQFWGTLTSYLFSYIVISIENLVENQLKRNTCK